MADDDEALVLLWRDSDTSLQGFVPVCPGEEVILGLAVDQGMGPNDGVGEAGNLGVITDPEPRVVQFLLSPEVSLTGSLTPELPMAPYAAPFAVPVDKLEDLGEFFVDTDHTYAAFQLDEGLPPVGSGWLFGTDAAPVPTEDLEQGLRDLPASLSCGTTE